MFALSSDLELPVFLQLCMDPRIRPRQRQRTRCLQGSIKQKNTGEKIILDTKESVFCHASTLFTMYG